MAISRSSVLRALGAGPVWAALGATVVMPCLVLPSLRDDVLFPKCLLAVCAAVAGALGWAAGGASSLAVGLEVPLGAFLLAAGASAAFSIDRSLSLYGPDLEPLPSLAGLGAVTASFYLGAAAARRDPRAPRLLAWALTASLVPVSAAAIYQAVFMSRFPYLASYYMGRVVGTFGHPVALGSFLAAAVPVAAALALEEGGALRRAAGGSAVLGTAALVLSQTRAGWAGAACGIALLLWRRGSVKARHAVFLIAAAVALGVAAATVWSGDPSRLDGGRPGAWRVAVEAFGERPLLGHGVGTFCLVFRRLRSPALATVIGPDVVYPHAHDDWFEVMATMGLAGLAAYAWLHAAAFARMREGGIPLGGAAAVAALFIFSKVNLPVLPAACLVALLAGAALGASPPRGSRALAAALFAGTALWGGWAAARRLPAEREDLAGRQARRRGAPREAAFHFDQAVRTEPDVIVFRLDLMNLLWDVASSAPAAERAILLTKARDVALEGARLRPREPEFLFLLGEAERRRAQAGTEGALPAAKEVLEDARRLDPLNPRIAKALATLGAGAGGP